MEEWESGYSGPWRLVRWLDQFLTFGQGPLKETWGRLSAEEQTALGVELLKCYLFQPLFLRFSREEGSAPPRPFPFLENGGKLLQVEDRKSTPGLVRFIYPLAHHRFWPVLLTAIEEKLFSLEAIFNQLQPEITLAVASHQEKIRERAETLQAFFLKWQNQAASGSEMLQEQINPQDRVSPPDPKGTNQAPADGTLVKESELIHSAPPVPDPIPVSSSAPLKKKKNARSKDQLKMFQESP